jgi:hypothetical protein
LRKRALIVVALAAGFLLGALLVGGIRLGSLFGGADPETVASASLQSMHEQSRLTPFTARFVAVVTSSQSRLGLSARKTLIMPGTVRYEVDLGKLDRKDLDWDESTKTLTVALPALELSGPEVNPSELREYGEGGVLIALTGGEARLDDSNRAASRTELLRQARDPLPMRLAREAAKRAIERSFAMPLAAAGIDANVVARFPEEGSPNPSQMDRSRRVEDVLKERQKER